MKFFQYIKLATKNLLANKSRSFLTMLGIIIGISSVILITTVGNGGKEHINGDLKSIGSNTISITINTLGDKKIKKKDLFKNSDKVILSSHPEIEAVSPELEDMCLIKLPDKLKKDYVILNGADSTIFEVFKLKILFGRTLSELDNEEKEKVTVIDSYLSKKMFGTENSVGKEIKLEIGNKLERFLIIGVYKNPFEKFLKLTGDTEGIFNAIIPRKTAYRIYRNQKIDLINVKIKDKEVMSKVILDIKNLLETSHNNENVYIIKNESKEIETFDQILDKITMLIGFVAAISLIVGGIGVMNIMLVSVTERTREIGIRKALGAQKEDILTQFLLEAVIITIIGGIIGVVLGYSLALLITKYMKIKAILKLSMLLSALFVSGITGIIFGVMPAKRAAELEPIEALRHE